MFIGHFAPALVAAAHPKAPRLGLLFAGAQLVDIGFATLLFSGAEAMRVTPGISAMNPMDLYHMPFTHSLLGCALWGLAFGVLVALMLRSSAAGVIAGLVVLSHWFIDWLVHIPDLTLMGSEPKLGLGLWNVPWAAMPLELAFIGGGFWWLARARGGMTQRLWVLLGVLLALQAFNWFGPQDSEYSAAIPATMLAAYAVLIGLAVWADAPRAAPQGTAAPGENSE
jgi:hypothetical protein